MRWIDPALRVLVLLIAAMWIVGRIWGTHARRRQQRPDPGPARARARREAAQYRAVMNAQTRERARLARRIAASKSTSVTRVGPRA